MTGTEWVDVKRAEAWPSFRESLPHAADSEAMLVGHLLNGSVRHVLDLGTGDGHLVALIRRRFPDAHFLGLDLSAAMVSAAQTRFVDLETVSFAQHDLMQSLRAELGRFDLIVSALAIHHLPDERKRALFAEVMAQLEDGGRFYDLDCVTSPSPELHALSQSAFGFDGRSSDPSDQPASMQDQLDWLTQAGFEQVDCHWKWMELALVGGRRPC
jgi:cyclopropane fatty-acyl-phospholipid synthase-like methyltransferase